MKTKIVAAVIIFFTGLISTVALAQKNTYTAIADKSELMWKGEKVTGFHGGVINLKSGSVTFEKELITGGEFIIDMTSIACTDLDEDNGKKLVGHLASEDFFSIEKFPTAKLVVKSSKKNDKGGLLVEADLTIKGVTKPITFSLISKIDGDNMVGMALINIDRTDFGIKYGSGAFFSDLGDKMIYDEFSIKIKVVAKK